MIHSPRRLSSLRSARINQPVLKRGMKVRSQYVSVSLVYRSPAEQKNTESTFVLSRPGEVSFCQTTCSRHTVLTRTGFVRRDGSGIKNGRMGFVFFFFYLANNNIRGRDECKNVTVRLLCKVKNIKIKFLFWDVGIALIFSANTEWKSTFHI